MHDLKTFLFAQTRIAEEEATRVFEPMVGVVVDIKDEGKLCRVRVKFPAIPDGTEKAWWATVVQAGAGKDRGWFTLPEVDDEVLCMFEHGDFARPVVVGAMWNGKDKAIDNNSDGKGARRVIKSKKGHKITFEDDKGTLTFEDGGGVGKFSIDSKKNMVSFETMKGDVTLQAKEDLNILAKEIMIKGDGKIDLCGKASQVNISAATITIEASGIMNIKGSRVDFHPGGVPQAAAATGTVADAPDPC